jgi:hypothetical protein
MVTVQRCQASGNLRDILELRGASITQDHRTTKESKTPRGVALAGGNHEQENIQSRVQTQTRRTVTRQPAMPLVQQSTRHRSGSSHSLRPRWRRHRTCPRLQTMQLTARSRIRQRQPHSSCTCKSRTPRTRPNDKTKTNKSPTFFEKRKNQDPVPFLSLI